MLMHRTVEEVMTSTPISVGLDAPFKTALAAGRSTVCLVPCSPRASHSLLVYAASGGTTGLRNVSEAGAAAVWGVQVQQPGTRGHQAASDDRCNTECDRLPEFGVFRAQRADRVGVELVGRHLGQRPRAQVPHMRREQPGPAEQIAAAEHLDIGGSASGDVHVECDPAGAQNPEAVRPIVLFKDPQALAKLTS